MEKEKKISIDQAFRAMVLFLEKYYKAIDSDDVRVLCSDLQLLPDGTTADPAVGKEWLECLQKAIADKNAGKYIIDLSKQKK